MLIYNYAKIWNTEITYVIILLTSIIDLFRNYESLSYYVNIVYKYAMQLSLDYKS